MGTAPVTASIVCSWGKRDIQSGIVGPRYDSLEVRPNKRTELSGIGIVKPIDGEAVATVTIFDLKNKIQIYQEEFKTETNFLEGSEVKIFKSKVILQPNLIYRIRVTFQGAACYTYLERKPIIINEDLEIEMRKTSEESMNANARLMNIITDLRYKPAEKHRMCAG